MSIIDAIELDELRAKAAERDAAVARAELAEKRLNGLLGTLPPLADKISAVTERQCFALRLCVRSIKRTDSYSLYRQCDECPLRDNAGK